MFSVIFDMDGTLFDSQRIFIPAWNTVGEKYGFKNMGEHIPNVCGVNEHFSKKYLKENFPGIDVDSFKTEVREYIIKNLVLQFKTGAKELLEYLRSRNVKIGLATGTSRGSTNSHLEKMNITDFFAASVCGTEIENGKPAPDIFLKTAELMGVNPNDCFVFEDSENGIRAASAAGMKCIGIADIKPFSDEVKSLMYCELGDMFEAIELFEKEQ